MAESMRYYHIFVILFIILASYQSNVLATGEIELRLQMREETAPFTRIGTVVPSLPPNIGTQLHFLTDSTFFTITPTTGEIMVSRLIDRERLCPEFKLCCGVVVCELKASIFVTNKAAGEFAASVALKVEIQDQNDNRPVFNSPNQTVSLSEASPVGTFTSLQPAKDADIDPENQIQRYTLVEPTGTFRLDISGLPTIRLELVRPLDREDVAEYRATLEACDPGACVRQTVEIQIQDENDNNPILANNKFTRRLIENTAVGMVVLKLTATDPDSGERGKVVYSFKGNVDSDLAETFELVRDTGEIRLKRPLAANIRDSYEFKVVVCDAVNRVCSGDANSTAEIVFMVQDVNNYPPSIHAVAAGAAVNIDSAGGGMSAGMDTSGSSRDNMESDYKFGGSLSILENSLPSQIAVLTVRDEDTGDNARVSCSLNNTNEHMFDGEKRNSQDFVLNPSAPGIYSLRTAREFDFEMESTIRTTIVCHDYGKPNQLTSARVITVQVVDVNEFQPEFSRRVYVGRVPENAPAGLEILTTTAIDRDRAALLRYKFAAPLPQQQDELAQENRISNSDDDNILGVNQYFVIEQETGVIRTSQISLDREILDSVTLVVLVTDSILPPVFTATTTVSIEILDENDNAPVFVNPPSKLNDLAKEDPNLNAFSIMENAPRFTQLNQKLEARDPDQGDNGRVHFSLLATFALTRTPRRNQFIGHTNNNLLLSDKQVDDFPLHYINEPGLTRHVVDQPIFRITPSGAIETLVELDRETIPYYLLKIGVQDRGAQPLASTTMLRVNVLDTNDNSPIWLFPTPADRLVNLTTSMKPGSLAARLRAEDADSADAGRVEYLFLGPRGEFIQPVSLEDGLLNEIAPPNSRLNKMNQPIHTNSQIKANELKGYRVGPLYLNGTTGEIWVAQPLTAATINLHLRTQDHGTPRSHTDAWLTISVYIDPNEGIGFLNFGGDGTLNVTIILAMITVTAIISLFLIIGIVCVRRRPTRYAGSRNFNDSNNNNSSPINGTVPYSIDMNKDTMQGNMNSVVWPTSVGLYGTNPYIHSQMTNGNAIFDDGQMFAALHGPGGVMGYGAVVATSDTGSMIYLPQTPAPPSVMGSLGGSMTPLPVDLSPNGQEYMSRNQLHTYGTLTKNRGPVNTSLYAGTGGCTVAYEPHLDADSGDSGRGPSEESTQFLLNDNYRNGIATAHNVYQYGNYSGFRPPSRVGYYRTNSNVDSGSLKKSYMSNCQHATPNNGQCACYVMPDNGQLYPVNQYNEVVDQPNGLVPVAYRAAEFTAPTHHHHDLEQQILLQNCNDQQAIIVPRSPKRLNADNLSLHKEYGAGMNVNHNSIQTPNNANPRFYQISDTSNSTSTFQHQHYPSHNSDDSTQTHQTATDIQIPLKLDLRGQVSKPDADDGGGTDNNITTTATTHNSSNIKNQTITIKPGLPPLAVKSTQKLIKTNDCNN